MKKGISYFILFFLASLILIPGCKTDPSKEGATVTDPNTKGTSATEKFTVISRIRAEPDRLNPCLTIAGWTIQVNRHLFLPMIDHHPETGELLSVIAKSRPKVKELTEGPFKGGTNYTYEILDEAVWDNGLPVTGDDYAFTFKSIMNPKVGGYAQVYRSYLGMIKDIQVDPANSKKFTVTIYPTYIRGEYTSGGLGVIPAHIYDPEGLMSDVSYRDLADPDKSKELAKNNPKLQEFADLFTSDKYSREVVNGCGAYKLEEWTTGQQLILKKKENWWGDKLSNRFPMLTANPDKIIYKPIPDANAALSLLKNGELDVVAQIPNTMFKETINDASLTENYYLKNPPMTQFNYIGINNAVPKLNDKRVRQALAHLLDMEEVIKVVKGGMATPITGPINSAADYYHKGLKPREFNIEKARSLIKEAGWEDSNNNGTVDKMIDGELEELKVSYLSTPNNFVSENIALIFKSAAKKVGVDIELKIEEANVARKNITSGDFEMYTAGSAPDMDTYDPYQNWHTDNAVPGGGNRFKFGSAGTDRLIEEIRSTLDNEKRNKLFQEFQEILYDEVPVIFMYNSNDCVAVSKKFEDYNFSLKTPGYFENFFKLKK